MLSKIFSNTFIQIATKIVTVFIAIFTIKLLTNYLSIEQYGLYSKIYTYVSFFAIFADLGLYTVTIREIAIEDDQKKVKKLFANVTSIRLILGVVLSVLSFWVMFLLPSYTGLSTYLGVVIMQLFVLFGLFNSSLLAYLQAHLKMGFSFFSTILWKLVTLGLLVLIVVLFPVASFSLGTFSQGGILLVFLAMLVGNIVMSMTLFWYAFVTDGLYIEFDLQYCKRLFGNIFLYSFAIFLGVVFLKTDIFMLSLLLPTDTVDTLIGYYSVPAKIVDVGMLFSGFFLNSLLPVMTQYYKENKQKLQNILQYAYRLLFFVGIGISMFFFFFADTVIQLLANDEFLTGFKYTSLDIMQITSWVFVLYFVASVSVFFLIAIHDRKRLLHLNLAAILVNIIGNLILIPVFSILGAAIASVVSQCILLIGGFYFVRKHIRLVSQWHYIFLFTWVFLLTGYVVDMVTKNISHLYGAFLLQAFVFGVVTIIGWYFWFFQSHHKKSII